MPIDSKFDTEDAPEVDQDRKLSDAHHSEAQDEMLVDDDIDVEDNDDKGDGQGVKD
eukprot:COSAG02_NODE_44010_length_369_cov_2.544444_1_plen_55_part_10